MATPFFLPFIPISRHTLTALSYSSANLEPGGQV